MGGDGDVKLIYELVLIYEIGLLSREKIGTIIIKVY